MRLMHHIPALLAVLGLAFSPLTAQAQEPSQTAFQLEQFEPSPLMGTDILNVSTSDVTPHLQFSTGLLFTYVNNPLALRQLEGDREVISRLVEHQVKADLAVALGLFDTLALGFVLPAALYQTGDTLDALGRPGESVATTALQDGRVFVKARLLDPEDAGGFGVSVTVPVYIPFGDDDSFASDNEVRIKPMLGLEYRDPESFILALNAGFLFRPERESYDYTSSYGVPISLGAEIFTGHEPLSVIASVFTNLNLGDRRDPYLLQDGVSEVDERGMEVPVEALAGIRYRFDEAWSGQVGAGAGLTKDVGSPNFRAFLGVAYQPQGSAEPEPNPYCPEKAADYDGPVDEYDCPVNPFCPDKSRDYAGPVDENDCPVNPYCPDKPKDYAGPVDENDCPVNPHCPDKPKDYAGPVDAYDCPVNPHCPDKPKDYDGPVDENDCPVNPHCPDMPRDYAGPFDDLGCPAKVTENVKIEDDQIVILKKVFFAFDRDVIKRESYAILDEVADVLTENLWITGVRVEGHTDNRGSAAYNKRLSARRAKSVMNYLVKKGVAKERLTSEGYGFERPLESNATDAGRAANRRVEFHITTIRDVPVKSKAPAEVEMIDNRPTSTE